MNILLLGSGGREHAILGGRSLKARKLISYLSLPVMQEQRW